MATQITPPSGSISVAIQSPAEGLLTNAATVNVTGTVSDSTASLTVQGQSVTPNSNGTWSLTIAPPEGMVTITAQATKAAATAQAEQHIIVDRTPPVITLTQPVPPQVSNPSLNLVGLVDDPTAMLTFQNKYLAMDSAGAFSAMHGLSNGSNAMHFRAVDPAGNVGTLDVSTTYTPTPTNNPPIVVFDTPMDGYSTNASSVLVQGHVDDPKANLIFQGVETPMDAQGRFERTLNAPKPGV